MNSVVIPAYNEEDTIEKVVGDCRNYEEIIVVDDCSTDKTSKILKRLKVKHIRNKENLGHAKSLLKGLHAAHGEYVLYIDADNQIKVNADKFDIVAGYRVHRKDKFFRKVVSFLLKMIILFRHGIYIRDANCPYKIFDSFILAYLLDKLPKNSVVPTISLMILARKYNMRVLEIPVEHYPLSKPRKGFLQSLNKKSFTMFWNAFREVISL